MLGSPQHTNHKNPPSSCQRERIFPGSWAVSIDVTSGKSNLSSAVAGLERSRDICSREICLLTLATTSSSSSPPPFGNLRQSQPRPICTQIAWIMDSPRTPVHAGRQAAAAGCEVLEADGSGTADSHGLETSSERGRGGGKPAE